MLSFLAKFHFNGFVLFLLLPAHGEGAYSLLAVFVVGKDLSGWNSTVCKTQSVGSLV